MITLILSLTLVSTGESADIPPEARKHMARGQAAVEEAKNVSDYKEAVEEFKKAVNAAPGWAEAHYNLGIAQEGAGLYSDSIQSFKHYMQLAPDATDIEDVQAKIFKLEYKMEKAASPSAERLAGIWSGTVREPDKENHPYMREYLCTGEDTYRIEVDGTDVKVYLVFVNSVKPYGFFGNFDYPPINDMVFRFTADGTSISGSYLQPALNEENTGKAFPLDGEISYDWNTITFSFSETIKMLTPSGGLVESPYRRPIITMRRR